MPKYFATFFSSPLEGGQKITPPFVPSLEGNRYIPKTFSNVSFQLYSAPFLRGEGGVLN